MMGSLVLAEAHGEDALAARIRSGMAEAQRAGGRRRAEEEEEAEEAEVAVEVEDDAEDEEAAGAAAGASAGMPSALDVGLGLGLDGEMLVSALIALGGDSESSCEDVSYIPEVMVVEAMRFVTHQGSSLSPMAVGKLLRWIEKTKEMMKQTSSAVPASKQAAIKNIWHVHTPLEGKPPKKRRVANVLEQGSLGEETGGEYELLSAEKLQRLRDRYENKLGGPPPEFERPTDDQLSALKDRLDSGLSPYTEFSVFGPYGKRYAKQSRYAEKIWTGSGWVTRQCPGPADLQQWCRCWRVFRSSMFMLRGASIASLDAYEESIKALSAMFPHAWNLIVVADEVVRSERWERIRDDTEIPRVWKHRTQRLDALLVCIKTRDGCSAEHKHGGPEHPPAAAPLLQVCRTWALAGDPP